jgi:hypothetical protein
MRPNCRPVNRLDDLLADNWKAAQNPPTPLRLIPPLQHPCRTPPVSTGHLPVFRNTKAIRPSRTGVFVEMRNEAGRRASGHDWLPFVRTRQSICSWRTPLPNHMSPFFPSQGTTSDAASSPYAIESWIPPPLAVKKMRPLETRAPTQRSTSTAGPVETSEKSEERS